jgi:hypothetical protein
MGAMIDGPWGSTTFSPPTPVDIGTIETAIVARLRSRISSIEITHYPDRPESWRMAHRVGSALVIYRGATYGNQLDTAAVIQERTLEFEVAVMMRDLGWSVGSGISGPNPGAYAIIEAVRALLTGYQIAGCRKLYPLREKFVERDKQGGVWIYATTFAVTTLALERPEMGDRPLFIRGVVLEKGGITTIAVAPAPYTFDTEGTIQLPHQNVFQLRVADEANSPLAEGTDFESDEANGTISIIAGGAAAVGETVRVAYAYAERGIAESGDSQPIN